MLELLEESLYLFRGVNPLTVFMALYFGLVLGSFLNVVIYRWPLQRSIVFPGSACGGCGTPLRLRNNIPLFSYLFQRGLCSYCGSPFSLRYFAIEALCGLASVFLLWHHQGLNWLWFYHFTFFCIATAVFFTDLDHWIIPDELNAFGVIFGCLGGIWLIDRGDLVVFNEFTGWALKGNLLSSVLGVVVGILFFKFIQILGLLVARQEAMGEGDVKYAAVLGAFLGWQLALAAFFLSFLLGAAFALPLMLFQRGKGKDPIPFGTFMSLASVPVLVYGQSLWRYLEFMEFY